MFTKQTQFKQFYPLIFALLISCTNWTSSGIVKFEKDKVQDGYTLIKGCIVYELDGHKIARFPGDLCEFFPEGEIIASLAEHDKLLFYNINKEVLWKIQMPAHHDITIASDQTIYVLSFENHDFFGRKVRFDSFYQLNKKGEVQRKWDAFDHLEEIFDALKNSSRIKLGFNGECADLKRFLDEQPELLFFPLVTDSSYRVFPNTYMWQADYEITHINTLRELPPNPLEKIDPRFKAGNLLLSFNNYGTIAILDSSSFEILWTYSIEYAVGLHDPDMLPNGNILMYINSSWPDEEPSTYFSDHSIVREIRPLTSEVVWEYIADPPTSFRSPEMCGVQRLPNGNTLVTDNTNGGRIFELTPSKEIVWEWENPEVYPTTGISMPVYQARRVLRNELDMFLNSEAKMKHF